MKTKTKEMFLNKQHTSNGFLTTSASIGDSVIDTSKGRYKLRKNGKIHIILDPDTENEEYIRVSPIK